MTKAEHPAYGGGRSFLTPLLREDVVAVGGVLFLMAIQTPSAILGGLAMGLAGVTVLAGLRSLPRRPTPVQAVEGTAEGTST